MFDFGNANEEQRSAITKTEGPLLVIAGPGTGKTFTLVKRIAYLVIEKNIKASEIMVVTFTEKAAKELLTRISDEFVKQDINININEMYIGTFHSVCLRILKENVELVEDEKQYRMMDAFENTYLVCRNFDNFSLLGGFKEHIPFSLGKWRQSLEICRYVNQMMEELVSVEEMLEDKDEDVRFLAKLVIKYQELLERNQVMDFASIQTKTYHMLKNHPDILKKINDSIKYIMVDEYQDTNYVQEQLIFLVAGTKKDICVVGDDDQGMYRFRGATIRNILEFPDQFEKDECGIIHLKKNYRSEADIVQFYNEWMENVEGINLFNWDRYRYPKNIVAVNQDDECNSHVFTCGGDSIEKEQEELVALVQKLKSNGNITDYNQVAFLFRSVKSEEAKKIGEYFEANGIPVYSPRSEMYFERPEIKQIIGCMMICFSEYITDLKSNSFVHRISDKLKDYYSDCVRSAIALINNNSSLREFLDEQRKTIDSISEATDIGLLDIFYRIISYEPFKSFVEADSNNILDSRAARNLSEMSRIIKHYCFLHEMFGLSPENKIAMPEELFNEYIRYLYIDGIGEYEDESDYAPSGCVSFMTIHQSKGLEFPVVVVGSIGSVPRSNNDPLLLTAETRFFNRPPYEPIANIKYFDFWRLFYVAFSRAQNLLVLARKKEESKYFGIYTNDLPSLDMLDVDKKFRSVKKVNYKHVYSFTSHISVYDGCPSQYKYYKEYGFVQNRMFHTSVGSLVHATLEDMNNCIIDGNLELVNEDAIEKWFLLNYQEMMEQTGFYLTDEQRDNALQQVIRYYHHRKEELGRVWKAEEEINLILPDYILQGIVDLVEGDDNSVEIVDYKTGPKPNIEGHPERVEHYRKQLEIYAYLIEKKYGKKVKRMHLYYTSTLEGSPLISFDWNKESIDNTVNEISDTIKAIEDKDFRLMAQNNYACRFCDMKYVCNKEC